MFKYLLTSMMFAGLAKYCSVPAKQVKPEMFNGALQTKMDSILAQDSRYKDTAVARWAREFASQFDSDFEKYNPNEKLIQQLKPLMKGVSISVTGGNWCSDTRRELPRLLRVLHSLEFSADSFQYYRVDRDKNGIGIYGPAGWEKAPIPDILFRRNGKEIGHIREITRKSMEEDMLELLR